MKCNRLLSKGLALGIMFIVSNHKSSADFYYEAIIEVISDDTSIPSHIEALPFAVDTVKVNIEDLPDVIADELDTYDVNISRDCLLLPTQNVSRNDSYFDAHSFCVKESAEQTCEACIPGFSKSALGGGCDPCAVGTFKRSYGNESCFPCSPGYSTFDLKGQTACKGCVPGSFSNVSGLGTCLLCERNHYQGSTHATACIACPPYSGTTSRGRVSKDQCFCSKGSYIQNDNETKCKPCKKGYFQKQTNATSCMACPRFQSTLFEGASSCDSCAVGTSIDAQSQDCIECAPGHFSDEGTNCRACDQGKYQNATMSSSCYVCDYGITQRKGSTSEYECVCPAGHAQIMSKCIPCGVGEYQPDMNATVCLTCPGPWGSSLNEGSRFCDQCSLGSLLVWNNTRVECLPCIEGSFYSSENSTPVCKLCERGKFSAVAGSMECLECIEDTFSDQTGSTTCSRCSPLSNTMRTTGATQCMCVQGSNRVSNGTCVACMPGTFQRESGSNCTPCPAGTYSGEYGRYKDCQSCSARMYTAREGSSSCDSCVPGTSMDATFEDCIECGIGYFSFDGDQCTACDYGKYQNTTMSSFCFSCDYGVTHTRASISEHDCMCPIGHAQISRKCVPCGMGEYQPNMNATACLTCAGPWTSTKILASTVCSDCAVGSIFREINETCVPCSKGFYFSVNKSCEPCDKGQFSANEGSTECILCSADTFSSMKGSTHCASCPPYSDTRQLQGAQNCTCKLGSAESTNGQCLACQPGKFQAELGASCFPCPVGEFSEEYGKGIACTMCDVGKFSKYEGSIQCANCTENSWNLITGSTSCECFSGFSKDANDLECVPCADGYYSNASTHFTCLPCPKGTRSSQSISCLACEIGKYSKYEGSKQCTNCTENSWNLITSSTSCECFSGFSKDANDLECVACAAGYYSNASTHLACLQCPKGTSSDQSISCPACEIGKYSKLGGSSECANCPENSWNDAEGSDSCTCFSGFTKTEDDTRCVPCVYGYYSSTDTLLKCLPCPLGTFNNMTLGQSDCFQCPPSTIAPRIGSPTCQTCENGSIADDNHTQCLCPRGYTFNDTQQESWSCKNCTEICPLHHYLSKRCSMDRDTVCTPCTTECGDNKYISSPCTREEDIKCRFCSLHCVVGSYMTSNCTATSDIQCSRCTTGCGDGYYFTAPCRYDKDAVCKRCPDGSYPEAMFQTTCIQCAPGTIVQNNSCVGCDGYSNANQTLCMIDRCPLDEYPATPNACAQCPAGTVGKDGFRCEPCLSLKQCKLPSFVSVAPVDVC